MSSSRPRNIANRSNYMSVLGTWDNKRNYFYLHLVRDTKTGRTEHLVHQPLVIIPLPQIQPTVTLEQVVHQLQRQAQHHHSAQQR